MRNSRDGHQIWASCHISGVTDDIAVMLPAARLKNNDFTGIYGWNRGGDSCKCKSRTAGPILNLFTVPDS